MPELWLHIWGNLRMSLLARPSVSLRRSRHLGATSLLLAVAALTVLACVDPIPVLTITSPAHGTFTLASSVGVTGTATLAPPADLEVTVNGVIVAVQPDGSFSTSVPVSQAAILNPVVVRMRRLSTGYQTVQRRMVIGGPAVADGMFSGEGIGMRINDTGLDQLQPTIQSLINASFNIQSLILAANPIINDYCIGTLPFIGCIGRVDVNATSVTYNQPVGVDLDALSGSTLVNVSVNNIRVNYSVSGAVSCGGNITASVTTVGGNYDQVPGNPATTIDVNQPGDVQVAFTSFNNNFTSGICDFPLIGDVIQLIIGDVQPLVQSGLVTNLRDPDGGGPADAPIAAAIQSTLAGLEIAGPIGTALGVSLNAEFDNVSEDTTGLTYRIDSRVTQPNPTPGSPDQLYSFNPIETFPTLGANVPVSGTPYGLGLALASGTVNQLLKAEIESGLLQLDLTEFQGIPLTAGLLGLFLPSFAGFPPDYPLTMRVKPTLAPFVTGENGPGGEIGDLRVPQVILTVVGQDNLGSPIEFLRVAFDARLGLTFTFDNATSSLVPGFGSILPTDITVSVLGSVSAQDEFALQTFLPQILALALPELGSSLGTFPLPSFLGLHLQLVELRKVNNYLGLFLNLAP